MNPQHVPNEGERRLLKLETRVVPITNSVQSHQLLLFNIPASAFGRLPEVATLLHQALLNKAGLDLSEVPPVRFCIEATFILRDIQTGQLRLFVGSGRGNKAAQLNLLSPFRQFLSLPALTQELTHHTTPEGYNPALVEAYQGTNTKWTFVRLVSLVVNFQCRRRVPEAFRGYTKTFYELP